MYSYVRILRLPYSPDAVHLGMMEVEDRVTGVSEWIDLQSADAEMTSSMWSGVIGGVTLWC